jgi:hypoxanthine phosphoribosyltransferase
MTTVRLNQHTFEPFIGAEEVEQAIGALAMQLDACYQGKRPLFVGVLNGAYFFAAELFKRLRMECELSFVKVASYVGTARGVRTTELIGLSERLNGRHVLVLEDIVDSGRTVDHVVAALEDHTPASISVVTMLFKPEAHTGRVPVDHVALLVPNVFVVGSGLDHDGLGRNLPGVYRIRKDPEAQ